MRNTICLFTILFSSLSPSLFPCSPLSLSQYPPVTLSLSRSFHEIIETLNDMDSFSEVKKAYSNKSYSLYDDVGMCASVFHVCVCK